MLGLVFRETMHGPFAIGESDPVRGGATGRAARTALTMRATISIADVAAFVRDRSHTAVLGGSVACAALGGTLSAASGVVRLFAPREPSAVGSDKVMFYGLRLRQGGRHLYLAGTKHVHGRSLWRLWPETTTLFTRLHDGIDEDASVIGAGVLRLSVLGLLRALPTMCAGPSPAATLARFGGFFMGQLWDSYVARRLSDTDRGANARRT